MGQFFKMAADYKKKIGFTGQLLIEPKPKEPMKHQYDYGMWESTVVFLLSGGIASSKQVRGPKHNMLAIANVNKNIETILKQDKVRFGPIIATPVMLSILSFKFPKLIMQSIGVFNEVNLGCHF